MCGEHHGGTHTVRDAGSAGEGRWEREDRSRAVMGRSKESTAGRHTSLARMGAQIFFVNCGFGRRGCVPARRRVVGGGVERVVDSRGGKESARGLQCQHNQLN